MNRIVKAVPTRTRLPRRYPSRAAALLVALTALVAPLASPGAPFDRSRYTHRLPLSSWMDPAELESWKERKILLASVRLVGSGHERNEIYATYCEGAELDLPFKEVVDTSCPSVYLGKLGPEEARRHLGRIDGREVNVYFTAGQVVPAPFVRRFGMIEAKNGAWVEEGTSFFYVKADSRVFRVPEGVPQRAYRTDPSERPAQAPTVPRKPCAAERPESDFLAFRYRLLDRHSQESAPAESRPLGRTSLLSGSTEFLVEATVPEWHEIRRIVVRDDAVKDLGGARQLLCVSSAKPDSCIVDFHERIAGQRIGFEVEIRDGDGARRTLYRQFTTLDTHPSGAGAIEDGVYVEREQVDRYPPDEVVRLVRLERAVGRGENRRREYRTDLPVEAFRVEIRGIKGTRIKSVERPATTLPGEPVRVLIPIFFNVSSYLLEREKGEFSFDWQNSYAAEDGGVVWAIRDGLRRAARDGVDAEFLLVDYAATARMFGPFRLHPGQDLSALQAAHNKRVLSALVGHLKQPPLADWRRKLDGRWTSDFASPLHTLNDLYLREYPGLVGALLITDGMNNPGVTQPTYLFDLWPDRIDEVDRDITRGQVTGILGLLDEGRALHDEAVTRFIETLDLADPTVADRVGDYLRELDPGGTMTLHPHREDRVPLLDALIVPRDVSLRGGMQEKFSQLIRDQFGGGIYVLPGIKKVEIERLEETPSEPSDYRGVSTLAQMIRRIYQQLVSSYVVVLEVPNDRPDGARRDLRFRVVEVDGGKTRPVEGTLRFMPYYTSSLPIAKKLPVLAGSPYVFLRLLSAYELRHHWRDERLVHVIAHRIQQEGNPLIRKVLLESAIVVQLKRLQVSPSDMPMHARREAYVHDAYEELLELANTEGGDPELARDAVRLAGRYLRRHPI